MANQRSLDELRDAFLPHGKLSNLPSKLNQVKGVEGNEGGLILAETSGAMKVMLEDNNNVHVLYSKDVCGVAEFDNYFLAQEISELNPKKMFVVFPYAITSWHQISVVINTYDSVMIVTDSLYEDRTSNDNIKHLASLLNINNIMNGNSSSNYKKQEDDWACGVYTICNTINIVTYNTSREKRQLVPDEYLQSILFASFQYSEKENILQMEREKSKARKRNILEELETLRDKEGNFKRTNPQDDLQKLADALQIETWGNLDRKEPCDNPGRNLDQKERVRERDIQTMIQEYEEQNQYDFLGIIILRTLKWGGRYQEAIQYHRNTVQHKFASLDEYKKAPSEEMKLLRLGDVYSFLGEYKKARQFYFEVIQSFPNSDLIKYFGVAVSSDLDSLVVGTFEESNKESFIENVNEQVVGKASSILISLCHLGNLYLMQSKYEEALKVLKRSNMVWESLGLGFSIMNAACLMSIGQALSAMEDHSLAVKHMKEAESITEENHGPQHISTLRCSAKLSKEMIFLGDYEAALHQLTAVREKCVKFNTPRKEVLVDCYETMAIANRYLGKFEDALECAQSSMELCETIYGLHHPVTASCLCSLATIYTLQRRHSRAVEAYQKAVDIMRYVFGPNHDQVAVCLNYLGQAYGQIGEHRTALDYLLEAKSICEQLPSSEHHTHAPCFNNLGNVYKALGQYDEAVSYFEQARIVQEWDHPNFAGCLLNLSSTCIHLKRYGEAKAYAEQAMKHLISVYGPNHREMGASYVTLSIIYHFMDDQEQSFAFLTKARELYDTIECPLDHDSAIVTYNLSIFFMRRKDYEGASLYVEKAKNIYESLEQCHNETALCFQVMCIIQIYTKNCVKAQQSYEYAKTSFQSSSPLICRRYYNNLYEIGIGFQTVGNDDKALEAFEEIKRVGKQVSGISDETYAECSFKLSGFHHAHNEHVEALNYILESKKDYLNLFGEEDRQVAQCYYNEGVIYIGLKQYEDALLASQKALEIYKSLHGPGDESVAKCLKLQGNAEFHRNHLEKALSHYRMAKQIYKDVYGYGHSEVADCLESMSVVELERNRILIALSLIEEAIETYKRLDGGRSAKVAELYKSMGLIYKKQGRFSETLECYYSCETIYSNIFGPYHDMVSETKMNIGIILGKTGDFKRSLQYFQSAKEINEKLHGQLHESVGQCHINMGSTYFRLQSLKSSVASYEEAKAIFVKLHGEIHVDVAYCWMSIGDSFLRTDKWNDAIKAYEASVEIYKTVGQGLSKEIIKCISSLVIAQYKLKDLKRATDTLSEMKAIYDGNDVAMDEKLPFTIVQVGILASQQGHKLEGIKHFKEALSLYDNLVIVDRTDLADCLYNLSITYIHEKMYAEALTAFERAKGIYSELSKERYSDCLKHIAEVHEKLGEHQQAIDVYQEMVKEYLAQNKQNSRESAMCLFNMAASYAALGHFQKALDIYGEVKPIFEELYGPKKSYAAMCNYKMRTLRKQMIAEEKKE